jgi:hypothetical protein
MLYAIIKLVIRFMKRRIGEMKVINVVGFLLVVVLVAQSFLTACPTGWSPEDLVSEETIQIEKVAE